MLQGSYFAFQQARGLHRYDASGNASHIQSYFEDFSFDPGTTCLRHLLPGSGTKWAHFTLWWTCLLFWRSVLFRKVKWAHFTEKEIFFLKSTMHSSNNWLLRWWCWSNIFRFGQNTVAIIWAIFMLIEDVKFHWSKKLKTACYFTIHGARGLAVGV